MIVGVRLVLASEERFETMCYNIDIFHAKNGASRSDHSRDIFIFVNQIKPLVR